MKNWNWNCSYLQKMSKRPKIQFRIRIQPWNYNTSRREGLLCEEAELPSQLKSIFAPLTLALARDRSPFLLLFCVLLLPSCLFTDDQKIQRHRGKSSSPSLSSIPPTVSRLVAPLRAAAPSSLCIFVRIGDFEILNSLRHYCRRSRLPGFASICCSKFEREPARAVHVI